MVHRKLNPNSLVNAAQFANLQDFLQLFFFTFTGITIHYKATSKSAERNQNKSLTHHG